MLTFVNGRMLVPFILVFVAIGCFVSEYQWQNLVILVLFSAIGYGFLRAGWPRAPFVIGLVLGGKAEASLNQALQLWGYQLLPAAAVARPDRHDRRADGLCGLPQPPAAPPPVRARGLNM